MSDRVTLTIRYSFRGEIHAPSVTLDLDQAMRSDGKLPDFLLARISHHPSTATFQWRVLAGFRSVGVLDIVSAMPARSSVAKATHAAPLIRLATNGGEKSGLALAKANDIDPYSYDYEMLPFGEFSYSDAEGLAADCIDFSRGAGVAGCGGIWEAGKGRLAMDQTSQSDNINPIVA